MFIFKLLLKIILLPVFLMVCFIRTWVEVLSRIGCVILGFFYLVMLAIIIMYVSKQMWGAVAISVGMSFGAFLLTFAAVAVGMAFENIGDKLSEWLAL
jgi:Ca2+/H+ antiporter